MAELTQKMYLDQTGLSAFWDKVKDYIDGADTNAGNLTLAYADKNIALKRNGTTISEFDASDFIKDSFVKSGEIVEKEVEGGVKKQTLRLTLITVERPGETGTEKTIDIDVDKLFSQSASDIKMADGKTVQVALTDVIAESAKNKTDITALDTAYKAADTELDGKISALDTAYKAADTTINGRIDDLDTAYKAADTTINGRIDDLDTAYKAADTALAGRVTTLEAIDHNAYVAADTALKSEITTAYQDADTAVYNAITPIPLDYINGLFAPVGA